MRMKRLTLLPPALVFALPIFKAAPVEAQTGESLIAQRGWDDDEEKEEKKEKKGPKKKI